MPLDFLLESWESIIKKSYVLATKVIESGYKPDIVIPILRGGAVPAAILVDALGVKESYAIRIKLYRGVASIGEKPVITQHVPDVVKNKKILLVDDVSDTGTTIAEAVSYLKKLGASEVKVATIHYKPWSKFKPDYYVEETDKWIIYPWEYYEFISEMKTRSNLTEEDRSKINAIIDTIRKILRKIQHEEL